jgi:kynurenine 3-monooxygenase
MLSITRPVLGRVIHHLNGDVDFQRYGKDDNEFNHSISRYELNKFLINKAEKNGAKFIFNHTLVDVNIDSHWSTLTFEIKLNNTNISKILKCEGPVLACDGGGSKTREVLKRLGILVSTETICPQGYKEIIFPKGNHLSRMGLHIWPRKTHFLMGLENLDGSFTGTIYINNKGPESFDDLNTKKKVDNFFCKYYSDVISDIGGKDSVSSQMINNPSGLLGTIKTDHFNIGGKICFLGDSCHAITPFFGQGTNASFEDCYDFVKMIIQFSPSSSMTIHGLSSAFSAYNQKRKSNSDAIADMAMDNFVEMRSRVGDRRFLLMKQVENMLENMFHTLFRSRYKVNML